MPPSEITLVVNRETGEMTLTNLTATTSDILSYEITSPIGAIEPTQLTPIAGNYDNSPTGDGSVDNNDAWQQVSPAGDNSVFEEETTGDAGSLLVGVDVSLSAGGAWIPSPTEDLVISITLDGNAIAQGEVVFIGNGAAPFSRSDLNFDGTVGESDWPIFRDNNLTDLSGLSLAQAYGRGDLDGDGDNDFDDFLLFQLDFDAANGSGALQSLLRVPESSTAASFMICGAILLAASRTMVRCIIIVPERTKALFAKIAFLLAVAK